MTNQDCRRDAGRFLVGRTVHGDIFSLLSLCTVLGEPTKSKMEAPEFSRANIVTKKAFLCHGANPTDRKKEQNATSTKCCKQNFTIGEFRTNAFIHKYIFIYIATPTLTI